MRESSMERVVGAESAEAEKSSLRYFSERFIDQASYDQYKEKEREKTPEEVAMISLANELTNGLLRGYELEDFNVPENNFHFLAKDAAPELKDKAVYSSVKQGVLVGETKGKRRLFDHLVHELLHFKSWNSAQVVELEDGKTGITGYRTGLSMITRGGEGIRLNNLNEAITEELAKRLVMSVDENELFADELRETRALVDGYGIRNADDIIFAQKDGDRIMSVQFAYPEHRKMLSTLVDKIFIRVSKEFSDREAVFDVFAKSAMTGNLLPVARLLDKTFGTGTFRKIGESDADPTVQLLLVDNL